MRFGSRLAIALIALLYTSESVRADGAAPAPGSENPAALQEARRTFEEGIALAGQERWFDAAAAFRRSRSFLERPSTLFNLASVLFRLGSFVEADQALTDYFKIAAADDKQRQEAERLQGLVRESLVTLELTVAPADASVQVDAKDQPGEGGARSLRLDPGSHVVTVRREGYRERSERLEAQAGKALRLDVRLEAVVAAVAPVAAPPAALQPAPEREPRDDDEGFFEQPIVWIVGGAVIVAAAITTGVLIANSGGDDPDKPFAGTSNMTLTAGGR